VYINRSSTEPEQTSYGSSNVLPNTRMNGIGFRTSSQHVWASVYHKLCVCW